MSNEVCCRNPPISRDGTLAASKDKLNPRLMPPGPHPVSVHVDIFTAGGDGFLEACVKRYFRKGLKTTTLDETSNYSGILEEG